jgi:hypothetical protein
MKPRKTKSGQTGAEEELERLIQAQRQDARTHSVPPLPAASDESLFTPDGAIRSSRSALRELVSPAADELLTRPPDEDDEEDEGAAGSESNEPARSNVAPGERGRTSRAEAATKAGASRRPPRS